MTIHCRSASILATKLRRSALAGLLALAAPFVAHAQVGGGDGFLLGTPKGSLTLRGGWALASAHSDLFSFTTSNLTLDRGDFSSPTLDADLAFRVAPRMDVVVSVGLSGMDKKSEFRKFIDNSGLPIEQHTMFDRVPMTVSIKHYFTDRGRSLGRLAWVPTRIAPYVGVGAGAMWYRFRQEGDFIDFKTNDVFNAQLESSGWTPTANLFTGAEVSIDPRFAIVTEAHYGWSRGDLKSDFSGFQRIDLSGFSTTAGLAVRF